MEKDQQFISNMEWQVPRQIGLFKVQKKLSVRYFLWIIKNSLNLLFFSVSAYILVEAGFDVWLGNARDNLYGRKNLVRNPKNEPKEFWDFTFHEIAVFDLPAMTDYVISKTGQEKIFFIGHSQGTLESYIFLAERPEYNYKFHSVFSFAPLSFMTNTKNAFLQTGAIYYKELYVSLFLFN